MSLYAIMTVYMLIAAGVITYFGVENAKDAIEQDGGKFSVGAVFGNATFRNIIISMVSTYGLYFFASLIFFDVSLSLSLSLSETNERTMK
jgi:chitin synthase